MTSFFMTLMRLFSAIWRGRKVDRGSQEEPPDRDHAYRSGPGELSLLAH